MDALTDWQLLELMFAGNANALRMLYRRKAGYVHQIIDRTIKNPHEAEQMLAEVFLAFYTTAPQLYAFGGHATVGELYRIARQRAWGTRRPRSEVEASLSVYEGHFFAPSNTDRIDQKIYIAALLKDVSTDDVEMIYLHYYDGYTQKEIAEYLNLPLGTVKSRISSILKRLRQRILQWERNESPE